ncbi:hypothetical protein LCGC14_1058950 [marine sediment metagenome]|uniref:Uncharacterized protein n=1 Tax=marine sediment metagenome TaxID=412755 RepID=A0A0F9N8L3_9ZZZZ|nr:hypothetical protein [bacterium]
MPSKVKWRTRIKELRRLSFEIYKNKEITKEQFLQRLNAIFPEFAYIQNVDNRAKNVAYSFHNY